MQRFLNAFHSALSVHNLSISDWGKKYGVQRTAVYNTTSKGVKPNDALLKAMCTNWPDRQTVLSIAKAHLEDEIERLGVSIDEITPIITGVQADPNLEEDLALIKSESPRNTDLRELLGYFAGLIREKHKDGDEIEIAPEVHNPYPPDWDKVEGTDEDSKRA